METEANKILGTFDGKGIKFADFKTDRKLQPRQRQRRPPRIRIR